MSRLDEPAAYYPDVSGSAVVRASVPAGASAARLAVLRECGPVATISGDLPPPAAACPVGGSGSGDRPGL